MDFTRSRWWPIMLGVFLAINLVTAILQGGRWNWLAAALIAGTLALHLARRRRDS